MAASVNKIILIGTVGKDPESFNGGASFSLATNSKYTNKAGEKVEETEWHRCKVFGKLQDVVNNYVRKGSQIYVEGRMKYGSYDNQQGVKIPTADVFVDTIQLLGSKGQSDNSSPGYSRDSEPMPRAQAPRKPMAPMDDGEDAPF